MSNWSRTCAQTGEALRPHAQKGTRVGHSKARQPNLNRIGVIAGLQKTAFMNTMTCLDTLAASLWLLRAPHLQYKHKLPSGLLQRTYMGPQRGPTKGPMGPTKGPEGPTRGAAPCHQVGIFGPCWGPKGPIRRAQKAAGASLPLRWHF